MVVTSCPREERNQSREFYNIAKNNYGIHAVEYVNPFYVDHATNEKFWNKMKTKANDRKGLGKSGLTYVSIGVFNTMGQVYR